MTIKVPDGMLKAAFHESYADETSDEDVQHILEAALQWLSDNPIVPTPAQIEMLLDVGEYRLMPMYEKALVEWQRQMFKLIP